MSDYLEQEFERLNTLIEEGRHEEALADIKNLIIGSPEEPSLYVLQGNALNAAGRLVEALQAYETAVMMDPMNVEARSNYSGVLLNMGRYVDALNAADAAVLTDKNFAPAYVNAGNCLIAMGHPDHAAYALAKAFELDASDPKIGVKVAELYFANGEYERARDIYFELARLPDIDSEVHDLIADLFRRAKEEGVTRLTLVKDVEAWRHEFATEPKVFELAKDLVF